MAKKILIIGNGFDIDLGLRTRYSDFAKSNIWEKLMRNTQVDLTQLFRRNDIKIILTKQLYDNDKNEIQKFDSFCNRLKSIKSGHTVVTAPDFSLNQW